MKNHYCRLCNKTEIRVAFTLPSAPQNIQKLLVEEELKNDKCIKLDVFVCDNCSFVQLLPKLEESYYDDYLMTTTHSEQMQVHQRFQANEFVERFKLTNKSVVEIGCGDGNFMNYLKDAGANVYGIEPSSKFRNIALSQNHIVEHGYVTADRMLKHGLFHGFVSRQVLEHVPDIHDFLTGIRRNLEEGAYGLIEVPSLEKAFEDCRYYDFFSDHVNYFSQKTLKLALEINGFEVLDVHKEMFDEYNVALVRSRSTLDFSQLQETSVDLVNDIRDFISSEHSRGRRVGVWGAGGKGLSVLSAEIGDLDLLVDADPWKQGRYTPVSHIKVAIPTSENIQTVDSIIITAMAYRNEIEVLLRNKLGFTGAIAVIGRRLELASGSINLY